MKFRQMVRLEAQYDDQIFKRHSERMRRVSWDKLKSIHYFGLINHYQ